MAPSKYTKAYFMERIDSLRKEICKDLPVIDPSLQDTFLDLCDAATSAKQATNDAEELLNFLIKEDAPEEEIKLAKDALASCEAAQSAVYKATSLCACSVLKDINILASVNEAKLLECTILIEATPQKLSDWVSDNPDYNSYLLSMLFSDVSWMKQMMVGGGASDGNYGRAIDIHSQLLLEMTTTKRTNNPSSDKTTTAAAVAATATSVSHKLALAVALEHATPVPIFKKEKEECVDPILRWRHYVNAYEAGELDSDFANLNVWEMRLAVDSNAYDDELTWGREMLKAYRPDIINQMGSKWKYVWLVRSDCNYKNPDHPFSNYKELISAGGKCGPRAFFGRFISKAWGLPTWGVRQPGHAALSRWTPDNGWTVCLGSAFKWSKWTDHRAGTNQRERGGVDFEEEALARGNVCPVAYYNQVHLLGCVACVMGESITEQFDSNQLWWSLHLGKRLHIASQESSQRFTTSIQTNDIMSEQFVKSSGTPNGSFVLPATAFVEPKKYDKKKITVLKSYDGGEQLHLEHDGSVVYSLPVTLQSGTYDMVVNLVNIHRNQAPLNVRIESLEGQTYEFKIEIPYTEGTWSSTETQKIGLSPGLKLGISRNTEAHGLSLKDFVFTLVS